MAFLPAGRLPASRWLAAQALPGKPFRRLEGLRSLKATLPEGRQRLDKYLEDCSLLGPVRFVCMTEGAILECVGSFDDLRFSDQSKGRYATVSNETGFECHINTDKVKKITMSTRPSKDKTHELYILRFLDGDGISLLSAMLHTVGGEGRYDDGAVAYWKKLRDAFGEEQTI